VQQQLPAHEVRRSLERSAGRDSGARGEIRIIRIVDRQSADGSAGQHAELAAAAERNVARAAARTGDDVRAALDRDAASSTGAARCEQQRAGLDQSAAGIGVGAGELDRAAAGSVDHDAAGAGSEVFRGRIAVLVGDEVGNERGLLSCRPERDGLVALQENAGTEGIAEASDTAAGERAAFNRQRRALLNENIAACSQALTTSAVKSAATTANDYRRQRQKPCRRSTDWGQIKPLVCRRQVP
jgi:hypothetical protein